jgi:hypothetical protein
MQDLDSFISHVPRFDDDIPIPAIPISARDPNTESSEKPPAESSANTPRTRACKRKAHVDLNPPKKVKKAAEKPSSRIKITGPRLKAHASSPLSGTRKGILILRSKSYLYHKFFLFVVRH